MTKYILEWKQVEDHSQGTGKNGGGYMEHDGGIFQIKSHISYEALSFTHFTIGIITLKPLENILLFLIKYRDCISMKIETWY